MTRIIALDEFAVDQGCQQPMTTRFREIEVPANLTQTERRARVVQVKKHVQRLLNSRRPRTRHIRSPMLFHITEYYSY